MIKYSLSGSSRLGSLIMQIMLFDMLWNFFLGVKRKREKIFPTHLQNVEPPIEVIFKLTAAANSNNLLNYFFVFGYFFFRARPWAAPFIGHVCGQVPFARAHCPSQGIVNALMTRRMGNEGRTECLQIGAAPPPPPPGILGCSPGSSLQGFSLPSIVLAAFLLLRHL